MYIMNICEQEVLNFAGQKVLDAVLKEFETGFSIMGFDEKNYTVGNGSKSVVYSRKNGNIVSRHFFDTARKLSRKGTQ
jgi:hypothetical protein